MIDSDNEPLVDRGRLTISSSDSEGEQFQVQSVCRASTGAEDMGRMAVPATSRNEGRISQACTVTAPSEDLAEHALSCGDLDAFPAFSCGGEEPRARVACQGHSQGVRSANAEPQVPLPPHPHGHPVELNRDDTHSLAAESDEGRTCSEAGVEGVHEEFLVDDEVPKVGPSAAVTREGFAQLG